MWFKFVIYLRILSNLFISYYYKGEGNILWCIVDVLNVNLWNEISNDNNVLYC